MLMTAADLKNLINQVNDAFKGQFTRLSDLETKVTEIEEKLNEQSKRPKTPQKAPRAPRKASKET